MCSHINLPALQLILDTLKQSQGENDGPLALEEYSDTEGKERQ